MVSGRTHAATLTVSHLILNGHSTDAAEFMPPNLSTAKDSIDLTTQESQTLSPVKQGFLIPTPGPSTLVVETAAYTLVNQVAPKPPKETGTTMLTTQALSEEEATDICATTSQTTFDLIPIEGTYIDRPDVAHADLNISLRGYTPVAMPLELQFYAGVTDADAPQLSGLFQPNRAGQIRRGYQVNDWLWACDGRPQGCSGDPISLWDVTMVGLATTPGEALSIPERGAAIYGGGYKAMVLYAAERQITLGYTRRDTVAAGYVVHIKDICLDPNLLALYRAQNNAEGWRSTGRLPALRNDQIFGRALSDEVKVAIRDNGSFMDPRSGKDWWR